MNIFTAMRRRLGPDGVNWIKGSVGSSGGPVCLLGAARVCAGYSLYSVFQGEEGGDQFKRATLLMQRKIVAKYGYDMPSPYGSDTTGIATFNDAEETTFSDIEWLLGECESDPDAPQVP